MKHTKTLKTEAKKWQLLVDQHSNIAIHLSSFLLIEKPLLVKNCSASTIIEKSQHRRIVLIGRCIEECEASIRKCDLRLQGKSYRYSDPKSIGSEEFNHWQKKRTEEQGKLGAYYYYLQKCIDNGVKLFNKKALRGKKRVLIKDSWERIYTISENTVSVYNKRFRSYEYQVQYAKKYGYHEIQDAQ